MVKDADKPRGRTTAYAYFVQACREEHKMKHPNETVGFADFSKQCGERWRAMDDNDKARFQAMANKDKTRYDAEMQNYTPPPDGATAGKGKKRKAAKDPNAPKRALSAFFCFCQQMRPAVRKQNPGWGVGEVAKELGKRWGELDQNAKAPFEHMAQQEKARYEHEMANYNKRGANGNGNADEDEDDYEDDEDE